MKKSGKKTIKKILATSLSVLLSVSSIPVYAVDSGKKSTSSVMGDVLTSVSENIATTSVTSGENNKSTVTSTGKISKTLKSTNENIPDKENKSNVYKLVLNNQPEDVQKYCDIVINDNINEIDADKQSDFKIHFSVKEYFDFRYRILSLKIGEVPIEDAVGKESFDMYVPVIPEMIDENGEIKINLELSRIRFADIFFDLENNENGYYSRDIRYFYEESMIDEFLNSHSNNEYGCFVWDYGVNEDEIDSGIVAVPVENYRVSRAEIDGEEFWFDENDYRYTSDIISTDQSHEIVIDFELNRYSVSVENNENVKIITSADMVNYDGSVQVKVMPDNENVITSIKVNDEVIPATAISNNTFTIDNIHEDKIIKVESAKITDALSSDFSWNSDDAISVNGNRYVFGNNKLPVFSTKKNAIRLIGQNNNVIYGNEKNNSVKIRENNTIKINAVELYYADTEYSKPSWHTVIDFKPVEISFYTDMDVFITPQELPDSCTCYNSDVMFDLNINVPDYSKISTIEYWITDRNNNEREHMKMDGDERTIVIPADNNNGTDMILNVNVIDDFENIISSSSEPFSINSRIPEVSVSIDGKLKSYTSLNVFGTDRIATIEINDRNDTLKTNDYSAFDIYFQAKGSNVLRQLEDYEKSNMITYEPNGDSMIIKVNFTEDGVYSWKFNYTNLAGLMNDGLKSANPDEDFNFTIDKSAPKASIDISEIGNEDNKNIFDTMLDSKKFNIYSKNGFSVAISLSDDYYDTDKTEYLISDKIYDENELKNMTEENWVKYEEPFQLKNDARFVVYAHIFYKNGKDSYICSDGHIIDKVKPDVTFEVENEKTYYNSNSGNSIPVKVNVNDAEISSGLKSIEYWVVSDGKVTQEKTLLEIKDNKGNVNIDINENNNSFDTALYVKVVDNAGNEIIAEKKFNIDITAPSVSVEYDNNTDNNGNVYFNAERTATITVIEKNFDSDNVKIEITAKNASGNDIDGTYIISEWLTDEKDNERHTATIEYTGDANYTFAVSCTDTAGNVNSEVTASEESKAIYNFTVDKNSPTGEIKIVQSDSWNTLLSVITFGFYTNEEYEVSFTSHDETSPTKIEYFISNDGKMLTASELDRRQDWTEWQESNEAVKLTDVNKYVVYAKITDYAGNYTYICSDGHIIDTQNPAVTITADDKIYNSDINVKISVSDKNENIPYSGIKSISYWVETDGVVTQEKVLYDFENEEIFTSGDDNKKPLYDELKSEWTDNITISAKDNNSSNVVLYVKAVDNAGNEFTEKRNFDIDITPPSIYIEYDKNNDSGYFNTNRTATVIVTERSNHFDPKNVKIDITAKNVFGNNVDGNYNISNWSTVTGNNPTDNDTHTLTIEYKGDANYTFAISCTDTAGNRNSEVTTSKESRAVYRFTVDKTAPSGTITAESAEGRLDEWYGLLLDDEINFGFWSGSYININGTAEDNTSPIEKFEYYKYSATNATDATSPLSEDELSRITNWTKFDGMDISSNEQSIVYFRIIDKAGNISYICTNGLIVDDTSPRSEVIAPEINITPEQTESNIYNGNVTASVSVDDPLVGGTYSGLKSVGYSVYNMGKETQNGELYFFDNDIPLQSELLKTWNGEIIVDASLNNSNDVVIQVYAQDNAGNYSDETVSVQIDITAPVVSVSYDNNTTRNDVFNSGRRASIYIHERNFSENYVNLKLTRNGYEYNQQLSWSRSGGTGNSDDTLWIAEVPFMEDGEYTFSVSCNDLASNLNEPVQFADGTVFGSEFKIDKTKPEISVTFDDEDSEPQGNYYKGKRTAYITITETNFSKATANAGVVITGNNNGTKADVSISDWAESENNTYTAIAEFKEDADYTLSVRYTDNAGNVGNSSEYRFTVDNKNPNLTVEVNGKEDFDAYSGEVIPIISYGDTNFDDEQVSISMTGKNVKVVGPSVNGDTVTFSLTGKTRSIPWRAKFETNEQNNEKILTFSDFPDEQGLNEFDDIYTLNVSLTDKSGRTSEKTTSFSVNRYGSTYDISSLDNLLGNYVKEASDVVVKEINPNQLKNYSITLFKNNETLTLEEGEGKDFEIVQNGNELEWHEYIYKINKDVFSDDGIYSITLHSEDKAGNISENTLDTKNSTISFAVDKTPPLAMVANLESNETYNTDKLDIMMTADDNLLLSSVSVLLDGELLKNWNSEQIMQINKSENPEDRIFSFEISGDSTVSHTLEVICHDAANNINEPLIISNFYVTTDTGTITSNWMKENIILIISLIAGVLFIIIGIILLFTKKIKSSSYRKNNNYRV